MIGVAADIAKLLPEEKKMMRAAGIGWFRCGQLGFDQGRFLQGAAQGESFQALKEQIRTLRADGFQVIGITPGPREMVVAAGAAGSADYFENYRRSCAFLGEQFIGLIDFWQVANELDIWIFRDSLSLDQAVLFLKAGIRGLKEASLALKVGINITLFPSRPGEVDGNTELHEGTFVAERIYGDPSLDLDYAGFDSYPGTWRRGGVESWSEYLDGFHALTRKPILIQEFGYSSAGGMMTEAEDKSGLYPCQARKWRFSWRGAHTPEMQAEFIGQSLGVFAEKPFVLGAVHYHWKDSGQCWQCGQRDCPVETAWGLVDTDNNPKPSYHRFKAAVNKYFPAAMA